MLFVDLLSVESMVGGRKGLQQWTSCMGGGDTKACVKYRQNSYYNDSHGRQWKEKRGKRGYQ
jgi:hypothetical protein